MKIEIKASGLPIWLDEETYRLELRDALTCASSGGKDAGQMRGLLHDEHNLPETEHCYGFYRDIVFEKDRELYRRYDFRYDITTILPGTVNGECKKTSGHYHGGAPGSSHAYPEVYEVLYGEATYILQKAKNFADPDPMVEEVRVVRVQAGQAIIIPPGFGHCSVNSGEGPLLFSNIAVVSCPLYYQPIKDKHGLSVYLLRTDEGISYVKNPSYGALPEARLVEPKENPLLGIRFGKPVYGEFVKAPEKFDFLLHPEEYLDAMDEMSRGGEVLAL